MKRLILLSPLLVLAMLMSRQVSAQPPLSVDATIDFSIGPVTTCVQGEGLCFPVTDYRIYVVGGGLLVSSELTEFDTPFAMEIGREYCFEAVAYNGLESDRSQHVCDTMTIAKPNAPAILSRSIRFTN